MPDREQRRQKIIDALNQARAMELQAIHQYMNHHYNLDDQDYGEMAKNMKLVALDEMRHAETFAERIKELGGDPTSELAAPPLKSDQVRAIFKLDSDTEDETIDAYNGFLKICRENGDNISAKLLETIIEEEQEHFNYFDNVNGHIEDLGDAYLSRIAGTPASTGLAPQGFVVNKGTVA